MIFLPSRTVKNQLLFLLSFACFCFGLLDFASVLRHLLAITGICRQLLAFAAVYRLMPAFAEKLQKNLDEPLKCPFQADCPPPLVYRPHPVLRHSAAGKGRDFCPLIRLSVFPLPSEIFFTPSLIMIFKSKSLTFFPMLRKFSFRSAVNTSFYSLHFTMGMPYT